MSLLTCAGLAKEMSLSWRWTPKLQIATYGLETEGLIFACEDNKSRLTPDTHVMLISIHECVTMFSYLPPLPEALFCPVSSNLPFPTPGSTTHYVCGSYKGRPWCGTSLKEDGSYSTWDYCGDGCPKDGKTLGTVVYKGIDI